MYLLWLFPTIWITIAPANFIIDSVVVLLALSIWKIPRKEIYKKTIFKVWGYGFLADLIGSLLLLAISLISHPIISNETLFSETIREAVNDFRIAVEYNPFENIFAFMVTVLAIIISGLCIYKFNLKRTFKNIEIDDIYIKRMALTLAIVTAPYMLLIPAYLFF